MSVAEDIAKYVSSVSLDDVDEKVVHEAKRRVLDMFGCAIGAFEAEPVRIVREAAGNISAKSASTIFGTNVKTSPEMATFVNTTMSRYLDFMDAYFYDGEIVHPEDNIASLFSVAESRKRSGKDVLLSTILAYEVCCRFVDFANIRRRGWDHVIWITASSAAATSRLMESGVDKTAEAISLGVSSNVPLRQIRVGGLSMWKGLAVAYATMAGVFSSNLANRGITGPTQVFEGEKGFFNQLTGKSNFDPGKLSRGGSGFKIMETHIKKYPAEVNSQSAIEAALQIRPNIKGFSDIKKIKIETFRTGYEIIADKSKWTPKNRETADHSLPYIVCVALLDGEIAEKQFSMERINDPDIRALLQRTTVKPTRECDRDYYPGMPNKVEVVTSSGKKYSSKVVHYRGSYKNPMNDKELEEKFKDLTKKYLSQKQIENVIDMVWDLEKQDNVQKLLSGLVVKK